MAVQRRPKKGSPQDKGQKPRWVARYRDHTGLEHSKTFDSEKAAKAWVGEQERALRRHEWIDPIDAETLLITVAQAWADETTVNETADVRRSFVRNLGPLGNTPVAAIKPSDILTWRKKLLTGRDWLDGSTLSEATTANTVGQLMSVLKRAQQDRMILAVPVVRVPKSAPSRAVSRQDLLTETQVQAAAQAANTPKGHFKARPWLRSMILVAADRRRNRRKATLRGPRTHCKVGHELTPENSIWPTKKSLTPRCRECERARDRKRRARQ